MNASDAISRLCRLQAEVSRHIDPESHFPHDCFCREGGLWPQGRARLGGVGTYDGTEANGYRNAGLSLDFIEATVRERIAQESAHAAEKPEGAAL